ncbi:MAG: RagB/SusD family nutrient uptake outer membrane protein [Chitinophagaceae bacterium]
MQIYKAIVNFYLNNYNSRKKISMSALVAFMFLILVSGCKKLVHIPEPVDTITTVKTFSNSGSANSAVAGIYYKMSSANQSSPFYGRLTVYPALTADELRVSTGTETFYQNNSIPSTEDKFWGGIYSAIYSANAVIEGLQASKTLTAEIKNQYTGEAKFMRALCFFYLTNLFGDVSLVNNTDFATNSLLKRTPSDQVYQQIVNDLQDAQDQLPSDYSVSGGERTRANKWAATALLARVYLYLGKWAKAEEQATEVLNNSGTYSLCEDLNNVFLKSSQETILQLEINEYPYATYEGSQFIPEYQTKDFDSATIASNWMYFVPNYYLTDQLVNTFESGDQRKENWLINTGLLNGTNYYYPYKYKVRRGSAGSVSEYNILLRLAELYLIRAEARAKQNNLNGAISDLNFIRLRASLTGVSSSLSQTQILDDIAQENRVEFFAEYGHRWFDLKRTGQADAILIPIKGSNWQTTDQLYPIPKSELLLNPNLTQNLGYQ